MSGVDNRIVNMQFNNSTFEHGVGTTLSSLEKLKQGLQFTGATKGLEDISAAAEKTNLSPIEGGITKISAGFLAMTTVALTALSNITTKALNAGAQIAKSLTIDPMKAGLSEYETNLGSIQTILSNTKAKGSTLKDVNAALSELNTYSDKTIYNFSEMANNIGTFTAAGVGLKPATAAIKGIANLAAVSGSSSEQASTAMYQLSQAMASGTVKLMDWNSVVNAGMGGEVFQKALIQTAKVHGVAVDDMVKKEGSFRETLKKGWLTTDVLTETLQQFTGDLSASQLKTMGYNEQQIKGILEMGQTATDAATKVKTMSQLMNTLQETAGSGWAQSWQLVFGDFEEAKELFTGVNDVIGGMISASSDARNKILGDWKEAGGRAALIESISNAFHGLMDVLEPIKEAFRDIFPPITGQQLADLTEKLRAFTEKLTLSDTASENLKRTFKGVFAIFDIVIQVIKGALGVIGDLIGKVTEGSGGFLAFTAKIGDFIVNIDKAIKSGTGLTTFFDTVSSVLQTPIAILKALAGYIGDLFGGFDSATADGVESTFGRISDRLSPFETLLSKISDAFSGLTGIFSKFGDLAAPYISKIGDAIRSIGQALGDAFSSGNFDQILDLVNTGLFGGLVLIIKKFLDGGLKDALSGGIFGSSGGGMFDSIKDSFEALSGSLTAMQQNIKADTLIKIAGAVALLTVSIVALSLIDSEKLQKALLAIGVAFGELLGAMKILENIGASGGFLKIPTIAGSMILLSIAILILTAAVRNLSSLSWEELGKGLAGVAGLMLILAAAVKPLSANASGMIRAGAGILALSVALKVLASAVGDFGAMDWGTIGKGLGSVAGALLVIAATMRIMPKDMVAQGAALILVGTALKIIASAVGDFGAMDWGTIGKGISGIAGALVGIAVAMRIMPKNIIMTAAGLVVLSFALESIGKTIQNMGGMSWQEIAKGLVTLAGSLVIIAGGLYLMTGTLAGSAALLVAAASLAILAPVLKTLGEMSWGAIVKGLVAIAGALLILAGGLYLMTGSIVGSAALLIAAAALAVLLPILQALGEMSWGEIVKGLVALAGVFLVLGVAGLALAVISPILVVIAGVLLAMGAALVLVGAGVLAFAAAISILVSLGAAAATVIGAMLSQILGAIPQALKAFGEGVVAFAEAIAKGGPAFVAAITTVMLSILKAIQNVAPEIGKTFTTLITTLLKTLVDSIPRMAEAGLKIITGVLKSISDNIYQIVTLGAKIITEFIRGIGDNLPKVIEEGVKTVVKFVNGVAESIRDNKDEMTSAGKNLAGAIVDGMVSGIAGGITAVTNKAKEIARAALNAAKSLLGIDSPSKAFAEIGKFSAMGMALGLDENSDLVESSSEKVANAALNTMKETMSKVSDIVNSDIDLSPVIAPVIDLTQFRKDAGQLQAAINSNAVTASVSLGQASDISTSEQTAKLLELDLMKEKEASNITFEQNNYSPKSLSASEIYRNTKSQLALAKEALT